MDFSNLIIRWTLGRTKKRALSLQVWDILECSILFAKNLFPQARLVLVHNSLESIDYHRLSKLGAMDVELIDVTNQGNFDIDEKNSFWKYYPRRVDSSKFELFLDSDIVLWKLSKVIMNWYCSETGILINTDWNGRYYGDFESQIPKSINYNAGIIGLPPNFEYKLPNFEFLNDLFHSEQGFIVKTILESEKEVFLLPKTEIFQSNCDDSEVYRKENITKFFLGGHFCGSTYGHYFDWDKYYKEDIWELYWTINKS